MLMAPESKSCKTYVAIIKAVVSAALNIVLLKLRALVLRLQYLEILIIGSTLISCYFAVIKIEMKKLNKTKLH